jgi:TPR repeat protein
MNRFIRCTVFALMVIPAMALAQDFDKGLDAAQAGDYATALREWTPLAEQGHASAQINLGFMYEKGYGVPQDFVASHVWNNLGAANGDKLGGTNRDNLAQRMTPDQIAEAQRRARVCMASNYTDCD